MKTGIPCLAGVVGAVLTLILLPLLGIGGGGDDAVCGLFFILIFVFLVIFFGD